MELEIVTFNDPLGGLEEAGYGPFSWPVRDRVKRPLKGFESYYTHSSVKYTDQSEAFGYTCIEVLEFLKGKQWDAVALAYVSALNPTYIRVADGSITCDARTGRVTVYMTKKGRIRRIEQEVGVNLPIGVKHGEALRHALIYGLDSEQVKWHQDVDGYFYDAVNGRYFKYTKSGEMVEFPK